jgi:hypothetical protein
MKGQVVGLLQQDASTSAEANYPGQATTSSLET